VRALCGPQNVTEVNSSPEILSLLLLLSLLLFLSLSLRSFSSGFSIFLSLSLKPGEAADKQTSYQEIPRLTNTHTRKSNLSNILFFFFFSQKDSDGNEATHGFFPFRISSFSSTSHPEWRGTPDRVIADRPDLLPSVSTLIKSFSIADLNIFFLPRSLKRI
jgi:hypothetical protein